jgi:hypothetical protein
MKKLRDITPGPLSTFLQLNIKRYLILVFLVVDSVPAVAGIPDF